MKIIVAQTAGFCMGVRRALGMVLSEANDASSPTPVCTDGPLIHNRQVLELLEKKGVRTAAELPEGTRPGTCVIRAHGVTPDHREEMESRCRRVVDATCPHVMRVQRIIKRYAADGYDTVIVGDAGHAEVNGLLGFARGRGHVVGRPEEVEALPPLERVIVVAQTTQSHAVFSDTVERLRARHPDLEVFETICNSTSDRQQEVLEMCRRVDALIVVGGRHSANTCRLAEISAQTGTPTFHVETDDELDLGRLTQFETVGVTAGASTPQWMIRRVIEHIEHGDRRRHPLAHWTRTALQGLLYSGFWIGAGAASIAYANARLLAVPPAPPIVAAAALFVLGLSLLNQLKNLEAIVLNEPGRGRFYLRWGGALRILGWSATLGATALALAAGWACGALVAAGAAAGLAYRSSLPRPLVRLVKFRRLEMIPGSKEIFTALAWTVMTCGLPWLAAGAPLGVLPIAAVAAVLTFSLVLARTVLLDMRDIEADQIVGQETLAVNLGAHRTKRLLFVLMLILLVASLWATLGQKRLPFGAAMLAAALYCIFYVTLHMKRGLPAGDLGEAVVDAGFWIPGLFVLAAERLG
jgi:4-hydroxy-3-methylbut-2-enyl diphosphate reductase